MSRAPRSRLRPVYLSGIGQFFLHPAGALLSGHRTWAGPEDTGDLVEPVTRIAPGVVVASCFVSERRADPLEVEA